MAANEGPSYRPGRPIIPALRLAARTLHLRVAAGRRRGGGGLWPGRPAAGARPRRTRSRAGPRPRARRGGWTRPRSSTGRRSRRVRAGPRACGRSGRSPTSRTASPSAAASFSRLVAVQPKMATAWALRGLCEFRLNAWAPALEHVGRACRSACRRART